MKNQLPQSVKASLWSYDTDKINLNNSDHCALVIINVLNRGESSAVDWLMKNFTKEEIAGAIKESSVSEWNKKSLSLWSLVFGAEPTKQSRFAV